MPSDSSYGSIAETARDRPSALPPAGSSKTVKLGVGSQDEVTPLEGVKSKSSVKGLLSLPHVRAVLWPAFLLSFLSVAWEVVFVLYSYTQADLGGMGRSVSVSG